MHIHLHLKLKQYLTFWFSEKSICIYLTISKFVQLFGKKNVLQVSQTNASVSNDKSLLIVRSHKNCDLINQPRAPDSIWSHQGKHCPVWCTTQFQQSIRTATLPPQLRRQTLEPVPFLPPFFQVYEVTKSLITVEESSFAFYSSKMPWSWQSNPLLKN